jgi:ankyrin repeat protein
MPCNNGETPTFAAFASSNMVIINLFVSSGADIDKKNNEGKTPLCYCSIDLLRELNLQYRVC